MSLPDDALTRAGQLMYRELPEEYRYRDNAEGGEPGDLQAFLHGFGHMLDQIRATTEQAYADAFAEPMEDGRAIQPWLMPYLAELVGAELVAPDTERRRQELNNAVQWSKAKGTLRNVDQVGDVISGAETVVREGWRLTLTCPRPALPPFSVPDDAELGEGPGRTPRPLGCPDLSRLDRAIADPDGSNPLYRLRFNARDEEGLPLPQPVEIYWQPWSKGGTPCFPGSYADSTARCPDLRAIEDAPRPGPHPGRALIHVRPPDGYFPPGLKVLDLTDPTVLGLATDSTAPVIDPAFLIEAIEGQGDAPHDRVVLKLNDDLTIPKGCEATFRDVSFIGMKGNRPARLRVSRLATLRLDRCAVEDMVLPGNGAGDDPDTPVLQAESCLFGALTGPNRFARLVYCTVMGLVDVARLQASDSLLHALSSNLKCTGEISCIRFSRFTAKEGLGGCFSTEAPTNTTRVPRFTQRALPLDPTDPDSPCILRPPRFGEPGYGVLDITTPDAVSAGAENDGEMGAFNHLHYAAQIRALRKKLGNTLPLGQDIALLYDATMASPPPRAVAAPTD